MMEIHLIRHGKTTANEKKLYCGQTDLPLSDVGAEEILSLKNQGIYPSADMFFTSGLLRTEQTLDIICGEKNRNIVSDVAEYKFGEFEMKGFEELKEQNDYQMWITDNIGDFECPNGESKNQFKNRVRKGYDCIVNKVGESKSNSALILCHGGVIACIMEYLFPNVRNFYEWQPQTGHGYTVVYDSDGLHIYKKI